MCPLCRERCRDGQESHRDAPGGIRARVQGGGGELAGGAPERRQHPLHHPAVGQGRLSSPSFSQQLRKPRLETPHGVELIVLDRAERGRASFEDLQQRVQHWVMLAAAGLGQSWMSTMATMAASGSVSYGTYLSTGCGIGRTFQRSCAVNIAVIWGS